MTDESVLALKQFLIEVYLFQQEEKNAGFVAES
jgi:hypothetical protein